MKTKENNEELLMEVLTALSADYASICLINTKERTVSRFKDSTQTAADAGDSPTEYTYDDLAQKALKQYLPADKRDAVEKELSLDAVIRKLADTTNYSMFFSVPYRGSMQFTQIKFHRISIPDHILLTVQIVDQAVMEEQEKVRQAERKAELLEKEKQEAVSANEIKNRFLSSLSHDIRTPINGLQGMLRIADAYPNDLKKQNECREKMWIAADYLGTLVNNVLDLNRLENMTGELTTQSFNLIDLLMKVTTLTDVQMAEQGLHSVVDWKPGYITHRFLIGSAEGLSRILANLNSNAIKYNKKGGTVYCRCKEIKCEGDTVWVEVINADTGIGMDEEFLKHAFDPYSQKENHSLNSINGVGLGLAIVKQTVELMHGTLKVESKVGEGTRYTIVLPFKIDPNPKLEPPKFDLLSLKGVKALLVEDNNLNMEIAKFCLEQENVDVSVAMNGLEAVEMFRDSEIGFYDIILMDIMMPIMDGLEATRQIRALNRPDSLAIPIIAMSANAFEQDIEKSLSAGMNAHLSKPIKPEQLTLTMKQYLANKIAK